MIVLADATPFYSYSLKFTNAKNQYRAIAIALNVVLGVLGAVCCKGVQVFHTSN